MTEKLLPCPFCGSNDLYEDGIGDMEAFITCRSCGAEGPIGLHIEKAVEKWNQRHD